MCFPFRIIFLIYVRDLVASILGLIYRLLFVLLCCRFPCFPQICAVCREAALAALDADMQAQELTTHDFEFALSTVHPQTTEKLVRFYEEYSKTLQTQIK